MDSVKEGTEVRSERSETERVKGRENSWDQRQ